jgi:hypothetical protein
MLRVCTPGDDHNDSANADFGTLARDQFTSYEGQGQPQDLAQALADQEHQISAVGEEGPSNPESVPVYFACPMSKHNPERYNRVYGPCTSRPGMKEFRRVKYEHYNASEGISELTMSENICRKYTPRY